MIYMSSRILKIHARKLQLKDAVALNPRAVEVNLTAVALIFSSIAGVGGIVQLTTC